MLVVVERILLSGCIAEHEHEVVVVACKDVARRRDTCKAALHVKVGSIRLVGYLLHIHEHLQLKSVACLAPLGWVATVDRVALKLGTACKERFCTLQIFQYMCKHVVLGVILGCEIATLSSVRIAIWNITKLHRNAIQAICLEEFGKTLVRILYSFSLRGCFQYHLLTVGEVGIITKAYTTEHIILVVFLRSLTPHDLFLQHTVID